MAETQIIPKVGDKISVPIIDAVPTALADNSVILSASGIEAVELIFTQMRPHLRSQESVIVGVTSETEMKADTTGFAIEAAGSVTARVMMGPTPALTLATAIIQHVKQNNLMPDEELHRLLASRNLSLG